MFFIIVAIVVIILVLSGFRILKQYQRGVVFRLGKMAYIAEPGVNMLIPFIDKIQIVDTRIVTLDLKNQQTITKDSVSIMLNAVLWYQVLDPKKSIVDVEDYRKSIEEFSTANLRSMIGKHNLDEILSHRDSINEELKNVVNSTVNMWGLEVCDIEIKNIELPENVQRAMAMEAEALREKRARIIKAAAELEASQKLAEASKVIQENPAALELRRMQMITEVGAEQNTTTIIMVPSELTTLAKQAATYLHTKNNTERQE